MPADRTRSQLALALALAASLVAGCTVEATGIVVTLSLGDLMPTSVQVDVFDDGGKRLGQERTYSAPTIGDGSTFGIQLADSLDGASVRVEVTLLSAAGRIGCGFKVVTLTRRKAVPTEIHFGGCSVENVDMGLPDLLDAAVNDATAPIADLPMDLAVLPDLAALTGDLAGDAAALGIDGASADLAGGDGGCVPLCAAGVATVCCGRPMQVNCGSGCDKQNVGCKVPTCATPTDITNVAGKGDSTGGVDALGSPCGGMGGPESVYSFTLSKFSMVQLAVVANQSAVLYTRSNCGAGPELLGGGNCNNAAQRPACTAGMMNPSQTLCGLPPGTYYTVVDSSGCGLGAHTITATITPSSLSDCPGAGMLPGPYPESVMGDSSPKMGSTFQAPKNTPNCGGGDLGASSPELVFFVPAPTALPNGHLRARLLARGNGFTPLLYIQQFCLSAATVCNDGAGLAGGLPALDIQSPGAGPYFVIVDGNNGSKGTFTLEVSWGP